MNRQAIILQKLIESSNCTVKQLSLLCEVSYKTIQSDIKEINRLLLKQNVNAEIVLQSGKGVSLKTEDFPGVRKILKNMEEIGKDNDFLPVNEAEWIAVKLLQTEYVKIDELCEELAASRSFVNKLLQDAKVMLQTGEILVCSRSHYGLYCKAGEKEIRQFLFEKLVLKTEAVRMELLDVSEAYFFPLKENLLALIHKFDVSMTDTLLDQLFLYIEIVVARRIRGQFYTSERQLMKSSFEAILAEKMEGQIAEFLNQECRTGEIEWIYRFVLGKCRKTAEMLPDIDQEAIEEIIMESVELIKDKYGFAFENDIELFSSLSIHLRALTARARLGNYSVNPLLGEIKAYSLLAYDMAVDVSLLINRRLGVRLPDDEISYIAIYLSLAVERKKKDIIPIRALVVCPTGKGMAELITHYLKRQYGEHLSIVKICGYYDLKQIDYSQYDYIFTMMPLKMEVPIPVVEFSLNENRYRAKAIKLQRLGMESGRYPLLAFSSPQLFFNDVKAGDKQEVLRQIVLRVGRYIKLKEQFLDSVLRREEIVATELAYGFAVPHPLERNMAEQSFFSVTVLPSPIVWEKNRVRIILLSYIHGDSENLGFFYDSFAKLVANQEYAVSLAAKPSYDNLIQIAKEISDEINL